MPVSSDSRQLDGESYFTANRRIGVISGALSLTATQVSAGTLIGTVGIHYTVGIGFTLIWIGIWAGWLFSMLFIAPKLRAAGGFTVSNYLGERFGNGRGHVRGLAAISIISIYLVYTAAQYIAAGVLLNGVLGIGEFAGISIVAVVALSYTLYGGMSFSVYSDAIQIVFLLAGIGAAVAAGLLSVGGISQSLSAAHSIDPRLVSLDSAPGLTLGLALSFGFGISIAPFELSRVYAMRDPETVKRAIPVSIAIQSVIAICIALIGLIARIQFPDLDNPDRAVIELGLELFHPVVGALLFLAVLVAIVSTIDSVLLVTAAAVAHDLFEKSLPNAGLLNPLSQGNILVAARAATVLAATVPVALTFRAEYLGGLIQLIVGLYTALLAGALFVPVVAGLHWSRANKTGAIAGMCCGLLAVVCWQAVRITSVTATSLHWIDPVVPGLLCSTAGLLIGTMIRQ